MAFLQKLLWLALCTLFATAGKADPLKRVPEASDEVLRPAATISGALVIGAVLDRGGPSDGLRFEALLPELAPGDFVCVSMLSSDGLYEAHTTYEAETGWPGGGVAVDYQSLHADKLGALGPEELAVQATRGTCADTVADVVYPVAWRPASATGELRLRLFINGFHADEVFVYVGSDPAAEPVACRKPEAEVQTAFDFVCEIALAGPGDPEIEINRVKGGRIAPPDYFTLHVGAPR